MSDRTPDGDPKAPPLSASARPSRRESDVEGFDALAELALDMRSAWNHVADPVWRQLDPVLWELTNNPWVVLQTVSREKLQSVLGDPAFRKNIDDLVQARRDAAAAPAWFQQTCPQSPLGGVAYFSMEFMLGEALPIYSGGLGNVAGDQLKAAGDLGVPVVGVGLLYQQGYFRQVIDHDGAQQALFPYNDPGQLPLTPLRQPNGQWLRLAARPAGLPDLAARLAGSGRPGEAVPARQQRCSELCTLPGDHQRALRRRTVPAPDAGAGVGDRRLAAARRARHRAASLPPERRACGVRRAGTRAQFPAGERAAFRRCAGRHAGRQSLYHPHRGGRRL